MVTQVDTDEGTPDIEISGPNFIIFIEVKVDSPLGDQQLERYRKAIATSDKEKQQLILLSRLPFEADREILDFNLRWIQIGDWLDEERNEEDIGENAIYLIEQFTGFLQFRGLIFAPPRTRLSRWLKNYLRREKENSIFYQKNIRSLRVLDGKIELKPLKDQLEAMGIALRNTFPNANIKVGSGMKSRKGDVWIVAQMILIFSLNPRLNNSIFWRTFWKGVRIFWKSNKPPNEFGGW
ncbi:hypothetical protein ACFLXI_08470 [Chloroflexota bacterium]